MKDIVCHIDMSKAHGTIKEEVVKVWGKSLAYHVFNVSDENYQQQYLDLARTLGTIRECHPVNDKSTKFSNSRDIKYTPGINHYFASNKRQPLHNDYAYYKKEQSPDWLILYCIQPSEYGGLTSFISTENMKKILEKYNEDLLKKILDTKINYKYNGLDGDKIHKKRLFDGKNINWNYWQVKDRLNSREVLEVRDEFFNFLEEFIVGGSMFDMTKRWNTGDCIIFNDHQILHCRSSFLGDRWLKDHAFYEKVK